MDWSIVASTVVGGLLTIFAGYVAERTGHNRAVDRMEREKSLSQREEAREILSRVIRNGAEWSAGAEAVATIAALSPTYAAQVEAMQGELWQEYNATAKELLKALGEARLRVANPDLLRALGAATELVMSSGKNVFGPVTPSLRATASDPEERMARMKRLPEARLEIVKIQRAIQEVETIAGPLVRVRLEAGD